MSVFEGRACVIRTAGVYRSDGRHGLEGSRRRAECESIGTPSSARYPTPCQRGIPGSARSTRPYEAIARLVIKRRQELDLSHHQVAELEAHQHHRPSPGSSADGSERGLRRSPSRKGARDELRPSLRDWPARKAQATPRRASGDAARLLDLRVSNVVRSSPQAGEPSPTTRPRCVAARSRSSGTRAST